MIIVLFQTFARRALGKVNELSQLERISSAPPSAEIEAVFRQATVKVNKLQSYNLITASSEMSLHNYSA